MHSKTINFSFDHQKMSFWGVEMVVLGVQIDRFGGPNWPFWGSKTTVLGSQNDRNDDFRERLGKYVKRWKLRNFRRFPGGTPRKPKIWTRFVILTFFGWRKNEFAPGGGYPPPQGGVERASSVHGCSNRKKSQKSTQIWSNMIEKTIKIWLKIVIKRIQNWSISIKFWSKKWSKFD